MRIGSVFLSESGQPWGAPWKSRWCCTHSRRYVPYAVTYMKTSRIPGVRVSMLMDLGLGALIGIGNAVVSLVPAKA